METMLLAPEAVENLGAIERRLAENEPAPTGDLATMLADVQGVLASVRDGYNRQRTSYAFEAEIGIYTLICRAEDQLITSRRQALVEGRNSEAAGHLRSALQSLTLAIQSLQSPVAPSSGT